MKPSMMWKTAPLAFAALIGAFAASAPARAAEDEITVLSPYTIHRTRESGGSLIGSERITVSRAVSYRNLDLRRTADVMELNRRVDYAARDVCSQLDRVEPASYTLSDTRSCYVDAVRAAQKQIDLAVAYANS